MVARDRQRLLGAKGERRVEDAAQPIKRVGDSHSLCDCLLAQTRPDTGGADVLDQPPQCRTPGGAACPPAEASVPPKRAIAAHGLVVAPGFIDLHSHSGLMILAAPRHEPKLRQGVTTELIGVDGNSYAPFPSAAALG